MRSFNMLDSQPHYRCTTGGGLAGTGLVLGPGTYLYHQVRYEQQMLCQVAPL